ncbi:MarR family transcriptional regulator [Pseudonocardia sulfidoxydans NBRC 16205]|uniref:MarR family transcriptional regulator n=1 Tax=Pseudonocardia sulfidoxydans NBRC 16205 TaxID=1223511 RepID=A0A511DHB2_9PSEU|nr:MarR family transcriptional regulator [Pseudonocardia sulfidoxydans]GEL22378.1 MarR family transcriptional regulator [Pseudonocardia sulfidoxydans NBRC 16205]
MENPTVQVSLALLLARAERYVTDRLDDALRSAGLTVDQYRVLLQLVDGQGHSMAEIAERAVLAAATLTRVVDRLSQLKLVHRRIDALDRRRVLIFMSHRGAPVLQQVVNQEDELRADLEARLGVADLGHLLETLAAMVEAPAEAPAAR